MVQAEILRRDEKCNAAEVEGASDLRSRLVVQQPGGANASVFESISFGRSTQIKAPLEPLIQ